VENYLLRLKAAIPLIFEHQELQRKKKDQKDHVIWLPLCAGKKGRSTPVDHSALQLPFLNELVKVPKSADPGYTNQLSLESAVSSICSSFYSLHRGMWYVSFDRRTVQCAFGSVGMNTLYFSDATRATLIRVYPVGAPALLCS